MFLNTFVNVNGLVQINVPIGPGGKPRRLILKHSRPEAAR